MKKRFNFPNIFLVTFSSVVFYANPALATQAHGGPEGVYAHQIAHVFFAFSMGILIYWLRERDLVKETGWRLIQYAALFFILWNIDAFAVHFLDDQSDIIRITQIDSWHIQINAAGGSSDVALLYYLAKLDHLLCVPALLFLFAGLRRLLKTADQFIPRKVQA